MEGSTFPARMLDAQLIEVSRDELDEDQVAAFAVLNAAVFGEQHGEDAEDGE